MLTPSKNYTNGEMAIVLHAHLPYVRSRKKDSLEQDWFYQALMECYLPLLQILENSLLAEDQDPKITIGLSPTLLSLLENKDLKDGFKEWISTRLDLLKQVPICHNAAVEDLSSRIIDQLNNWNNCNGELISRFAELERKGVVDLLTCAATHGYLPLLRENKEAVKGQLNTAVREHIRIFGSKPLGIWLPECAYYEGLDKLMIEAGLRYAILDGHGLLNAHPRPRYGIYAPICTANGVAFFARDSKCLLLGNGFLYVFPIIKNIRRVCKNHPRYKR